MHGAMCCIFNLWFVTCIFVKLIYNTGDLIGLKLVPIRNRCAMPNVNTFHLSVFVPLEDSALLRKRGLHSEKRNLSVVM